MSDVPAIIASGLPGNREEAQRAGITIAARMAGSLDRKDSNEIRRWTVAIVVAFLIFAAFTQLNAIYSHKFYDVTGHAMWIWPRVEVSSEIPVAFFAARDFDLPKSRYYTHIKVAADPEYTLYLNGRELASLRMTDASALDLYDVSSLVRDGRNRIVIAVRSVKGVGGLIASVDIAPETENFVVTDRTWRVSRTWDPRLLARDVAGMQTPIEIGEPPVGRWNYLQPRSAAIAPEAITVLHPVASFQAITSLPEVKIVSGTAIASTRRVRAFGYDFGWTDGQVIEIRYANAKEELMMLEAKVLPVVFAPGESSVVDPEPRHFRWIGVYGRPARAEVVTAR